MTHNKFVSLPENRRILVCSDLHGNLKRFQNLLISVQYSFDDILIIVGDICEKGDNSLGLVRFLMELSITHEVYITMGNCDTIYEDVADTIGDSREHDKQLLNYMLWRKHCILNEMSEELHYSIQQRMNMKEWKALIRKQFAKELDFLNQFPMILETEKYYFVHAGLCHTELLRCTPQECLTTPAFLEQNELVFDKTLIVGHWPVSLYHKHYMKLSPLFDHKHHIISIDGGNVIKREGQINMLILKQNDMQYTYMDELPVVIAKDRQLAIHKGFQITYQDAQVRILQDEGDCMLCEHVSSKHQCYIPSCYLYEQDGLWYSYDFSDYDLEVQSRDPLKMILQTTHGCYMKKDGICGWYYGTFERN